MSATIFYEPVKQNSKSLDVSAPSTFQDRLAKAFGGDWTTVLPRIFGKDDIPTLQGMSATQIEDNNPYQQMIDLIEKYDQIRVWAQY